MFRKVLIANRGEIANRILKTLNRLNIKSVAIFDERESDALYIKHANESACLGSGDLSDTFLNIDKILKFAIEKGCDAIHPGYGFLSENAKFAEACINKGITYIGPSPSIIELMGNKTQAISEVSKIGIPVIPNIKGSITDILNNVTDEYFPCIIKASAGGGGKGMQIAESLNSLSNLLIKTSRESEKYFGNAEVYIEKYLNNPRHIEVQIIADRSGNVIHLFERECSVQRRFQKIIEESPAVILNRKTKESIFSAALKIAQIVGYTGAGTIEFLLDGNGDFYFLEMNTRIQVEHTVTEMVTNIDIVEEQLSIAAGNILSERLRNAKTNGHAIEARIYAEDPANNYNPSPGIIKLLTLPFNDSLRIDMDLSEGRSIISDFDPMIAKIIVRGESRNLAIERMLNEIKMIQVHGIKTNIKQLVSIFSNEKFRENNISTHFVDEMSPLTSFDNKLSGIEKDLMIATGTWLSLYRYPQMSKNTFNTNIGRWRIHKFLKIIFDNSGYELELIRQNQTLIVIELNKRAIHIHIEELSSNQVLVVSKSNQYKINYSWNDLTSELSLSFDYRIFLFRRPDILNLSYKANILNVNDFDKHEMITAPLSGKIIKINYTNGQNINKGDTVLLIESMKMENEIRIPFKANVKQILVKEGDRVNEGDLLLELKFE